MTTNNKQLVGGVILIILGGIVYISSYFVDYPAIVIGATTGVAYLTKRVLDTIY